MATAVGSILRAATRDQAAPLHVLTYPTHERYQQVLSRANARFFLFQGKGIKTWNSTYAPLPSNHTLYDPRKGEAQVPLREDFDLVLSQNKLAHFGISAQLCRQYHLPLISLEHCLPPPNYSRAMLDQLKSMRGHVNVFISEYSREKWGWDESEAEVIHHGVDTKVFSPCGCGQCQNPEHLYIVAQHVERQREPHILSVVNDWVNRDWCCGFQLWQQVTKGLSVRPVGDTPGLSKPAVSVEALVGEYRNAQVFINTSLVSPVPTALLEAMACGCAVVSTANCMIPEIIQQGENGLMANDPGELRQYCQTLLDNPVLCKKLGEAARRTILERFSLENFVARWNEVFAKAADIVYRGEGFAL